MRNKEAKMGAALVINVVLIVFVVILCVCFIHKYNMKQVAKPKITEVPEQFAYTIKTENTKDCNQEATLYYEKEDYKIYTYCIDSMKIIKDDKEIELKDYLADNENVIAEIIKELETKDTLNDGGTVIYEADTESEFTNQGLTIIKCHKISSGTNEEEVTYNNDIYIGPKGMEYQESYCKIEEKVPEEEEKTDDKKSETNTKPTTSTSKKNPSKTTSGSNNSNSSNNNNQTNNTPTSSAPTQTEENTPAPTPEVTPEPEPTPVEPSNPEPTTPDNTESNTQSSDTQTSGDSSNDTSGDSSSSDTSTTTPEQ